MLNKIKNINYRPLKSILFGAFFLITISCDFPTNIQVEWSNSSTIEDELPQKQNNARFFNPELTKDATITLAGKVVKVTDGDTIELLVDGEAIKIRLSHIDAPEKRNGQPYWRASKNRLSELCEGEEIIVKGPNELDRYKRFLGELFTYDGRNLNKVLVEEGLAWHYKQYSDDEEYADLERQAQLAKRGLWQEKNAMAPWEWRKFKKVELKEMDLIN